MSDTAVIALLDKLNRFRSTLPEDERQLLDGILLALSATATLEGSRDLRALLAIAALTLPEIAVAVLLTMPGGNPLASQPGGYAWSFGVAGVVFLVVLFALRRRGIL